MRIRNLIFIPLLFIAIAAYGGGYYSDMLCDGLRWVYFDTTMNEVYKITGSKTLNGKTYGLLKVQRNCYGARSQELNIHDDYSDSICVRDEDGRIYVNKDEYLNLMTEGHYGIFMGQSDYLPYEATDDGELVLYDFTKKVGDVYCLLENGSAVMVTKVEILKTEDGVPRRRLTLSNGFDLIEGVGCTNSKGLLLFWLNTRPSYLEYQWNTVLLTTFSNNGNIILARDYDVTISELSGHLNKLLTPKRRWVYDYDNGQMKGTLTYSIEGDTLLYGYKRTKFHFSLTDNQTNKIVRSGYAGAINDKNGFLWYLAPDAKEDKRLYKSDWREGSAILSIKDGVSRNVFFSDDVTAGNESCHRLYLVNMQDGGIYPSDKDSVYYWVEGIGCSKGLLDYKTGPLLDSIQFVACYDGEKCIFTRDDFCKETTLPNNFTALIMYDSLVYCIDTSTMSACFTHSGDYQSMNHITIQPSVDFWGVNYVVNKIDDAVFYGNTKLISIKIPESVESIGKEAFRGCTCLESIELPIGIATINANTFYGCEGLKSIKIPEGVTSIAKQAFYKCEALKVADLPVSLTAIDYFAFGNCNALEHLYCRAEIPPTEKMIGVINPDATLHVPAASLKLYKETYPWSDFKYIVPIEDTNAIKTENSQNPIYATFDLQGRPVQRTSKHGVYVKDGRKVIR